jgi:hypothetical protein
LNLKGLKPNIIKLDIEGYEDRAINGGKNLIKKYKPIMYIERPTSKLINFLKKTGYKMYVYDLSNKKFTSIKKTSSEYRNYYFLANRKYL